MTLLPIEPDLTFTSLIDFLKGFRWDKKFKRNNCHSCAYAQFIKAQGCGRPYVHYCGIAYDGPHGRVKIEPLPEHVAAFIRRIQFDPDDSLPGTIEAHTLIDVARSLDIVFKLSY